MSAYADPEQERVFALVRRLFCGAGSRYGPFDLLEATFTTRIPGTLYSVKVLHPDHGVCLLSVFSRVGGDLVGRLWDQEVRVLLRIRAAEHPALPRVQQGGFDPEERLAWMLLDTGDGSDTERLNAEGVLDELRDAPAANVGRLLDLAEGLSLLHGHGVVHRNIWPGAVTITGEGADATLRLERLEMSTLVTNLVHGGAGDPTGLVGMARGMMREGGIDQLRYLAPERLDYLLADDVTAVFESERTDVFGLAAMAWEWFLGPMPVADHVDAAKPDAELSEQLRALHAELRRIVRTSPLPRPLADLLNDMLHPDPTARPSAAQVVDRLLRRFDGLMASFEPPPAEGADAERLPLVFFMPEMADRTLERWDAINHPPTSPEGVADQRELIEQELAGAKLVHSPRGALDYVPVGSERGRRAAQWVFVGKEYAWFCVENERQFRGGRRGPPMPDVLRIMFVQQLHRQDTANLGNTRRYRRIAAVEALRYTNDEHALEAVRAHRPTWRPLLEQVRRPAETGKVTTFLQGLEWLLEHQAVEQQLREYPFRRETAVGGEIHELVYDQERELPRIRDSSLYGLLAKRGERPAFAAFFTSEAPYADDWRLEYADDRRGRPGPNRGTILEAWMDGNDPDRLIVRVDKRSAAWIPERGWLRPHDHSASRINLTRQARALVELRSQRGLIGQLREPKQITTADGRWAGAGADLKGDAPDVIRRMLSTQQLFALHGPPGTGKTTVVAHAVEAFIRQEPGARVLIAAQANDALDNLALRVLKQLAADDVIALRVAPNTDRIDPKLHRWTLDALTARRANAARRLARERISAARDTEGVRAVLRDWIAAIDRGTLELQERLRRGASIVFATCSGSSGLASEYGGFSLFDWVIIEEAAKAWPTELAIALVQGIRWTLVGDHRQLPAYRREEVTRVLERCGGSDEDDEELREVFTRRDDYARVFDVFAELFSDPDGRPVDQLTLQFRMRKEIAGVVSRAFYKPHGDKPLRTDPSADRDRGVRRPARLAGRAFVWLDTADVPSRQRPRWRNEEEAAYVARLLDLLDPLDRDLEDRARPLDERLAVLTPWKAQVTELKRQCDTRFGELIHTVDSFQGREADIVVSSVVRDRVRSEHSPHENLGHAVHPHRMNVMLSRARGLNLVVGAFDLFAESGIEFWQEVCGSAQRIPILEVIVS